MQWRIPFPRTGGIIVAMADSREPIEAMLEGGKDASNLQRGSGSGTIIGR